MSPQNQFLCQRLLLDLLPRHGTDNHFPPVPLSNILFCHGPPPNGLTWSRVQPNPGPLWTPTALQCHSRSQSGCSSPRLVVNQVRELGAAAHSSSAQLAVVNPLPNTFSRYYPTFAQCFVSIRISKLYIQYLTLQQLRPCVLFMYYLFRSIPKRLHKCSHASHRCVKAGMSPL
jgi:hypothetical protein